VDLTDSGYDKEVLYFPAHYNGKSFYSIGYSETIKGLYVTSIREHMFNVCNTKANKIYFPYTINSYCSVGGLMGLQHDVEFYFAGVHDGTKYSSTGISFYISDAAYYNYYKCVLTPIVYEEINESYQQSENVDIANTQYLFNYEEAPNEGYFFINGYAEGELIENTPYEPVTELKYSHYESKDSFHGDGIDYFVFGFKKDNRTLKIVGHVIFGISVVFFVILLILAAMVQYKF